jgi:tRNA threonylcarbamoyladenosine biosynthesis protein TsaE
MLRWRRTVERFESFSGARGKKSFTSAAPEETVELGKRIGSLLPAGAVMSLEGGLGTGKTLLAKGICAGLGVRDEVVSPSFILVEEYSGDLPVLHFDLYRLELVQEVLDIGLLDVMNGGNVVIVEWGDRLPEGMLQPDVRVLLRITGELEREIAIDGPAPFLESLQGVTGGDG